MTGILGRLADCIRRTPRTPAPAAEITIGWGEDTACASCLCPLPAGAPAWPDSDQRPLCADCAPVPDIEPGALTDKEISPMILSTSRRPQAGRASLRLVPAVSRPALAPRPELIPMITEIGHDLYKDDLVFVALMAATRYPAATRAALDELHRLRRAALLGIDPHCRPSAAADPAAS